MERKITEAQVTLESECSNDSTAIYRVTSTFVLSNPMQMKSMEQLIQGYISDRKVFTVSYS